MFFGVNFLPDLGRTIDLVSVLGVSCRSYVQILVFLPLGPCASIPYLPYIVLILTTPVCTHDTYIPCLVPRQIS